MKGKIGLLGPLPSQWTSKWEAMKQKALETQKDVYSANEEALDTGKDISPSKEEVLGTGEDTSPEEEEALDTEEEDRYQKLKKELGANRDPTWHALVPIVKGLAAFWPSDRMSLKDAMVCLQQVSEKYYETITKHPELEQWRSSLEEYRYREAGSSIKEPWYHNPEVWESFGITEFPEEWKPPPPDQPFEIEDPLFASSGSEADNPFCVPFPIPKTDTTEKESSSDIQEHSD
jgi:hypothetical protein